jgi:hypothetical protein
MPRHPLAAPRTLAILGGAFALTVSVAAFAVHGSGGSIVSRTEGAPSEPSTDNANANEPSTDRANATSPTATTKTAAPAPTSLVIDTNDLSALTKAFEGNDDVAKLAALSRVVEAKDTKALPALLATDLSREPEAAPMLIQSVAKLAQEASPNEKAEAAKTLGKWLGEESKRHEADAQGNVPNLVEALGQIGGPEATAALTQALQSGKLDLSVETLVAQTLTEKGGNAQSLEALQQFLSRAEKLPPGQGIEEELRVEALQAAKQAVSTMKAGGSK